MANSKFNCIENVNAEHPKSLFVFSRIFFGINVKDGEPQVIVNLCVGFLISRAGGPLVIDQVWAGLAVYFLQKKMNTTNPHQDFLHFFCRPLLLTNERPSSLDSLSL